MNDIEESDIELDFTGVGRWNFAFNMENIFSCLRLETYPRNKEKPRFLQNLADTVVHHDFTIAFSGVDMEEGVGFIQKFEFESKYTPYFVETLKEAYYALPYDNAKRIWIHRLIFTYPCYNQIVARIFLLSADDRAKAPSPILEKYRKEV